MIVETRALPVRASLRLALLPEHHQDLSALVCLADRRTYQDKATRRRRKRD